MNQHQSQFAGPRLVTPAIRVAACVLTCQRPKLLERCLDSIAGQLLDHRVSLELVIVINGRSKIGQTFEVIEQFRGRHPDLVVTVARVPERNIAKARNCAVARASYMGAQHVWFMDDDAVAEPDCLAALMSDEALRYDVVSGITAFSFPDPMPFWAIAEDAVVPNIPEFHPRKVCNTGNCRFSVELWRQGLRFDDRYGLIGGEDHAFFEKAHLRGFKIVKLPSAIARETYHRDRLTYPMQIYKAYCEAANGQHRLADRKGRLGAIVRRAPSVIMDLGKGGVMYAAGLLARPFSVERYKRLVLTGGRRMARGRGRIAAMLGGKPQSYRTIEGE